jgi:transcription factor SPN1
LDALPAHLVTPFNGPIPPSNLLDKIARGVSQAKGPSDWPHSIRATRVKLLELARSRAKEDALLKQQRHVIKEEVEIDDGSHYSYFHEGEERSFGDMGITPRRPLYRQSSMDFIKPSVTEIRENTNIARSVSVYLIRPLILYPIRGSRSPFFDDRLSSRLQRSDRSFSNPAYHPYSRITHSSNIRRSSSPPPPTDVPSLINPSTPSSTTLNSFSSFSSQPCPMHRPTSTLSSGSMFSNSSHGVFIPDPRVQRVRRSDSFYSIAPVPPPKDNLTSSSIGLKRAPSYGALAQGAKQEHTRGPTHIRSPSGSYPSSDEEEKIRTTRAKKIKTKTGAVDSVIPTSSSPPSSTPSSPRGPDTVPSTPAAKAPTSPIKDRVSKPKSTKVVADREEKSKTPKSPTPTNGLSNKIDGSKKEKESRPLAMNLQRNPSMLGPELPHLCGTKEKKEARSPAMNLERNPSMLGPELPRLRNTAKHLSSTPYGGMVTPTRVRSPSPAVLTAPPPVVATIQVLNVPESPTPPKVKTLRRVRRLAPARRISFGSLIPGDEADADGEGEAGEASRELSGCLGSAFQLM